MGIFGFFWIERFFRLKDKVLVFSASSVFVFLLHFYSHWSWDNKRDAALQNLQGDSGDAAYTSDL